MKTIAVAVVLLILAVLGWLFVLPLFSSQDNGKNAVQPFIAASKHSCRWAGFVNLFKVHRSEVYVACTPAADFPTRFEDKDQFIKTVESQVVMPWIGAFPSDPSVSYVTIVQVSDSMVLCTAVVENRIRRSWLDTYDNYCLPA